MELRGIIEIDKLDNLLARHAELKVVVDAFGQTLNEVQRYVNETNIVVKDILEGKQISTWVDDLSASGKNSATYKDASRMNALLGSKDACRNNKVSQHIFDFAVANNKTGTYFGTALDNTGGVSWAALTPPASVCGNTAAFSLVAKDAITSAAAFGNAPFRTDMFNNYTKTQSVILSSQHMMNAANSVKKMQRKECPTGSGPFQMRWSGRFFVLGAGLNLNGNYAGSGTPYAIFKMKGAKVYEKRHTDYQRGLHKMTINKFVDDVEMLSSVWMGDYGYIECVEM